MTARLVTSMQQSLWTLLLHLFVAVTINALTQSSVSPEVNLLKTHGRASGLVEARRSQAFPSFDHPPTPLFLRFLG